jgi:NAD(P)-dependent dehydrogenase (short-subunit alcohol dehydrogenase family)
MMSLEGKVAFVTGAGSKRGMGHAVALKLASEGANIIVTDKYALVKSMFPGDETWGGLNAEVAEIKSMGRDALALTMDVSNSQEIDKAVAKSLEKFGKIDILVQAAGIRGPVGVPLVDLTEKDIRAVIEVDLVAPFLVCKAIARTMVDKKAGGKIVIISSLSGLKPQPGSAAYGAAKAGSISLTRSLALELAPFQINVNGINPGVFITNLRDETYAKQAAAQGINWEEARKKDQAGLAKYIPLGRPGTAEEIADLVYFLVSDNSRYMTGETIILGGGVN